MTMPMLPMLTTLYNALQVKADRFAEHVSQVNSAQASHVFQEALWLSSYMILQAVVLELLAYQTALALYRKNRPLYLQGVALNFFNHYCLATPAYVGSILWMTTNYEIREESLLLPVVLAESLLVARQVVQVLVVHSVCFYSIHRLFHTHKGLYKWHKFHHLFNTHVAPTSANAVHPVEYTLGYLSPFLVAQLLFDVSPQALWWSIMVISVCNIIMHTPPLAEYYDRIMPQWMVGTNDHLEHHKRLQCHYASPTLDMDYIVQQLEQAWQVLMGGTDKAI